MDGKKPVSLAWLRSTQGEGVWADNPAIDGRPRAWLTCKGEVLGEIADVQEIEDGYGVWLAGQDESVSVADGSPYFAAWLDETPAPDPTPSLADEMSETARVIRESLGKPPAPAPTPPASDEMSETEQLVRRARDAKNKDGARVKLLSNLAPDTDGFSATVGMLGTVRWGLSGWGVVFDDDPAQMIRLDCATAYAVEGIFHKVINLCVPYTPRADWVDDESAWDEILRESLDETPAPARTSAIVETLPLVRTPSADDMRGWLRSLNLMWTDYDAYTEYDYYLQDIDTDSKAHHNAVAFSEMVKAAMDAIKAVIDAIDPDEPPADQCPKCQTSDKTGLIYEKDEYATFGCFECGESWSLKNGTRVQ